MKCNQQAFLILVKCLPYSCRGDRIIAVKSFSHFVGGKKIGAGRNGLTNSIEVEKFKDVIYILISNGVEFKCILCMTEFCVTKHTDCSTTVTN